MDQRNKERRTILITRFSAVGDIAMTIPLLYSLSRSYPEHRFVFVSRDRFGQFFIDKPENLDFIGINLAEYKGIAGLYRLYRELKEKVNPDYIADLHDVLRTKLLRWYFVLLGKAKCAHIIKGRKEKRALTRKKGKSTEQLTSTFERYRDVFTRLGFPFEPHFTSLFGKGKGDITEFTFLPEKGDEKWIGIAPFARHKGKIYPLEKMGKVIELLSAKENVRIFCFGNGPQEEEVVNEWCNKYPRTYSFIGKTNFNGELRLISHLDVMISMDSANMHMASLAGTPAISIWGATSPLAGFLGWNQKRSDCLELPLQCRPCSIFGNKPCMHGDYRCMEITPETVARKVLERTNA